MYCVKCGVKLADSEKKCPLCNTVVYHPEITRENAAELYPAGKMPRSGEGRAVLGGAILIFFMLPLIITFFSDLIANGKMDWFGYVAGGVTVFYIIFALPLWFKNPNPVIFTPCNFAAVGLYLLYIDLATQGGWFLPFAFPILGVAAAVSCTLVTLLHYVKRGRLYVIGGSVMALGGLILTVELFMVSHFDVTFKGWSIYPLISLVVLGGLLIFLAINGIAREKLERRIFF